MSNRLLLKILFCVAIIPVTTLGDDVSFFEFEVAPILIKRCVECHQKSAASSGLVLTHAIGFHKGGDSGPAIDLDKPADSLLLDYVTEGIMPPESRGKSQKLPDEEIEVLQKWITSGAKWPAGRLLDLYEKTTDVRGGRDWWSLQPVTSHKFPENVTNGDVHPIDHFVAEKLQQHKMSAAPPATRNELIRRIYNGVIGLPPSFEQIQTFESNDSPVAWENLVDELLASNHFGERWARYWLDVVRFAETSGYERDQEKPHAWKYRDWVVDSFNNDRPYDEFIIHQLAGDELEQRGDRSLIATGFLRLGTWNDEPNDPQDYKYDRLEDLVHSTSSAFLGMTVKCARCHDHKFDPIPQLDYYRMASTFWSGPIEPRDRKLLGGPTNEELGVEGILGWTDVSTSPSPLHLLKNGNRQQPKEEIVPASLTLFPNRFVTYDPPSESATTSQRRLQLAKWIAAKENPLTARVMVNRIWQGYFGSGIVRSANNFGFTGDQPSHPELLDWLAAELVTHDWSLKHIHRLILTSQTYRQSAVHPQHAAYAEQDFVNRNLWRANRRRLDAESLRDAMLASSGEIDLRQGGPSFKPTIQPEALEGLSKKGAAWTPSPEAEQRRRSLYIYSQRSLLVPMMATFDLCDSTIPNAKRDSTTVAPQALTLLNNSFVHDRAEHLAASVVQKSASASEQIQDVWISILGRPATDLELKSGLAHIRRQSNRFEKTVNEAEEYSLKNTLADAKKIESALVLDLDANHGVQTNELGQVIHWEDQSSKKHGEAQHRAEQMVEASRPKLITHAINKRAAIQFDGNRRFLHVKGQLLKDEPCTIFVVATDVGVPGHRELISNWSREHKSIGSSLFLGMTSEDKIRWSDAISNVGQIKNRNKPFILAASNGSSGAAVFQNQRQLVSTDTPLPSRRIDTPWVIGQQGDIDGEYWQGLIAKILVYDRELTVSERSLVWKQLSDSYSIPLTPPNIGDEKLDTGTLSLASLCVVLFNSNEFMYVD